MRPHVVHWLEAVLPGSVASALAPTWFTCIGLAGAVALFAMLSLARRHRLDAGAVASIVLWCYVAAVAAGIMVPAVIDAVEQLHTTGRVRPRWAGMTSFWGYLAGGWVVVAMCRSRDLPLGWFAELATVPLGLALMVARLGCLLAGCDYGKVSSLPWAIRFPAHSPAWQDHLRAGLVPASRAASLAVHPTQLYEAGLGLAIAVMAPMVARRREAHRGDGGGFLIAAATYAVGRFAIEGARGDAGRGIHRGLSSGQIFSLLVLAAVVVIWRLRRGGPLGAPAPAGIAGLLLPLVLLRGQDAHAQPAQPKPPQRQPQPPPPGTSPPLHGALLDQTPPGPQPQPPPPGTSPPVHGAPGETPPGPLPPYLPPTPPGPPPSYPPPPPPPGGPPIAGADDETSGPVIHAGALVGVAAAFNRRRDQVPALAGVSLSIGLARHQLSLWLDLESLGNRDASHGTLLLSGAMIVPITARLSIGGRFGLGATLVNFEDPVFRDVIGASTRFEGMVDVRVGDAWTLWLRPVAIDVLSAADLGGPIATWQARLGVAYRFSVGRRSATSSPRRDVAAASPASPSR